MTKKQQASTGDPEAVLAAAAKQRRRALRATHRPSVLDGLGMTDVVGTRDDPILGKPAKGAKRAEPAERKPGLVVGPVHQQLDDEAAGWITRGVRFGMGSLHSAEDGGRRLGVWAICAIAASVMLIAVALYADRIQPSDQTISGMRISYLPGPQLPSRDFLALLRRFPHRAQLNAADDEVLAALAAFLAEQPVVEHVGQVRTVPVRDAGGTLRRAIEVLVALRRPEMPAILATGERVWVDQEGRLLPGALPGDDCQNRPVLRGLETGGLSALREALAAWRLLEPLLEPGLITTVCLHEPLGLKDQVGIVLCTKYGGRLIWGRPEDAEYGSDPEQKARDLAHTIRCQGDLRRIATINVRFKQPVFTLRD
jgi:hypothetical protein